MPTDCMTACTSNDESKKTLKWEHFSLNRSPNYSSLFSTQQHITYSPTSKKFQEMVKKTNIFTSEGTRNSPFATMLDININICHIVTIRPKRPKYTSKASLVIFIIWNPTFLLNVLIFVTDFKKK